MERFRKLKAEEGALQKKLQAINKKGTLYKSNNDSNNSNMDSNAETSSIYSASDLKMNEFNVNDITLKKMESSLNNSFAVYESINKMINDSFQPPKTERYSSFSERNSNYGNISDDSLNNILNDEKSPLTPSCDDDRSVYVVPLNDTSSPSVPQSKSSTIRKMKKNKKNYGKYFSKNNSFLYICILKE